MTNFYDLLQQEAYYENYNFSDQAELYFAIKFGLVDVVRRCFVKQTFECLELSEELLAMSIRAQNKDMIRTLAANERFNVTQYHIELAIEQINLNKRYEEDCENAKSIVMILRTYIAENKEKLKKLSYLERVDFDELSDERKYLFFNNL